MSGLFDGTPLERPVSCEVCEKPLDQCACPRSADGQVREPTDQKARKDQPVRVRREKRRKGKVVTVVEGLDPSASDLSEILRQLKSACAAGGKVADGVLEIQGDHTERVVTIFKDMGYPAKRSGG